MICSYCGEYAETYDHVVPISYKHVSRRLEVGNREAIPCCRECNSLLGNAFLHTVSYRAEYLIKKYKRRYSKIIKTPNWDMDELEDMGEGMRKSILARMDMRDILIERLTHLKQTHLADYSVQECKDKFIDMVYKPLHAVKFTKPTKGESKTFYVYKDEISTSRMLFENTFVEKAIEVLEERGVITDDCDIEVIRASSI